jgi:hypothetical protein
MAFNKTKQKSVIKEVLDKKKRVEENNANVNFGVSFEHYDPSQKYGSSFKDWQAVGLLSKMMDVLQGYCCSPLLTQIDGKKFGIYGDFPPADKTEYTHPQKVPQDAKWAKLHINGPAVLIGHVISNTFYIVFLDKTHKFYLTKKVTANSN